MLSFIKRLVPKNIAGILGMIGVLIPLVRELAMVVIRIMAVFMPKAEKWVESVGDVFDKINKAWDNLKRMLLGLAPNK